MGQKVNPHGLRVGVIKDWDSRWYAEGKDFSDNLVEDHNIRTFLKKKLEAAAIKRRPDFDMDDLMDFYISAIMFIQTCLAEGWQQKDSFKASI